jgi:hypothetical protein
MSAVQDTKAVATKNKVAAKKPVAAAGKKAAAATAAAEAAAAEAEAATAAAAAAASAKAKVAASAAANNDGPELEAAADDVFRSTELFRTYRWSSNDPDTVAKAKWRLAEMRHSGRKSAIIFDSVQLFDDGFLVERKEPAPYNVGFALFSRAFGAFQEYDGNSDQWRVEVVGSAGQPVANPAPSTSSSVVPAIAGCAAPSSGGPFHPCPGFKLLRGFLNRWAAGRPRELLVGPTIAARARLSR